MMGGLKTISRAPAVLWRALLLFLRSRTYVKQRKV
jgi:hypothetical protein